MHLKLNWIDTYLSDQWWMMRRQTGECLKYIVKLKVFIFVIIKFPKIDYPELLSSFWLLLKAREIMMHKTTIYILNIYSYNQNSNIKKLSNNCTLRRVNRFGWIPLFRIILKSSAQLSSHKLEYIFLNQRDIERFEFGFAFFIDFSLWK